MVANFNRFGFTTSTQTELCGVWRTRRRWERQKRGHNQRKIQKRSHNQRRGHCKVSPKKVNRRKWRKRRLGHRISEWLLLEERRNSWTWFQTELGCDAGAWSCAMWQDFDQERKLLFRHGCHKRWWGFLGWKSLELLPLCNSVCPFCSVCSPSYRTKKHLYPDGIAAETLLRCSVWSFWCNLATIATNACPGCLLHGERGEVNTTQGVSGVSGVSIVHLYLEFLSSASHLRHVFFSRSKRFPKILFQAGPIETVTHQGAKARFWGDPTMGEFAG